MLTLSPKHVLTYSGDWGCSVSEDGRGESRLDSSPFLQYEEDSTQRGQSEELSQVEKSDTAR